jgi:hypothetical protein
MAALVPLLIGSAFMFGRNTKKTRTRIRIRTRTKIKTILVEKKVYVYTPEQMEIMNLENQRIKEKNDAVQLLLWQNHVKQKELEFQNKENERKAKILEVQRLFDLKVQKLRNEHRDAVKRTRKIIAEREIEKRKAIYLENQRIKNENDVRLLLSRNYVEEKDLEKEIPVENPKVVNLRVEKLRNEHIEAVKRTRKIIEKREIEKEKSKITNINDIIVHVK